MIVLRIYFLCRVTLGFNEDIQIQNELPYFASNFLANADI